MKILNYGSLNLDHVYNVTDFVKAGETISSQSYQINCGGKGLNQSIALSNAGAEVYHAGKVGADGKILIELLSSHMVDTGFISGDGHHTGHAIIQVNKNGQNCILLHGGANNEINRDDVDKVLSGFSSGDFLVLQNEISNTDYIIEKAYNKKMRIVFNPSPITGHIKNIDFSKIEYLILNEVEGENLSGFCCAADILSFFSDKYPSLKVVLTLGKSGAHYQDNKVSLFQPAYSVKAVDTTAAGDTFLGFFVALSAQGHAPEQSLKTAACASALAVQEHGAAQSIPDIEDVMNFLNRQNMNH